MTKNSKDPQHLEDTLSTTEVARYCRVSVVHVNRWIKDGKIKCYRYPGGRYKISRENFREFLERSGVPVIEEFFSPKPPLKVLIGEDDTDFARGVRLLIEDRYPRAEIEAASDGYEVLLSMGVFRPDLLVLDLRLPRIDGLEVCQHIRQNEIWSGVGILAMTGHAGAFVRERVLYCGANEYLLKPFESTEFYHSLDRMVAAGVLRNG
ncbi:response regulator [bacterium]|nr:response regulator [bacterium]